MPRIKIVGQPKIRVVPTLTSVWRMNPYDFVKTARAYLEGSMRQEKYRPANHEHKDAFLGDPVNAWLSNEDLEYLAGEINLRNSAFLMTGNHCKFITRATTGETRIYDPMQTGIQSYPAEVILSNSDFLAVTRDMRDKWLEKRQLTPLGQYLIDSKYSKDESFVDRVQAPQTDTINCVPLSLYAAAQSARPRVLN